MTPEEIPSGALMTHPVGNGPEVLSLTNQALALQMEPSTLLSTPLIPALEEVGARFERGDFFVPRCSSRAGHGRLDGGAAPAARRHRRGDVGKFVMGTVQGDVHDIGKNLVNIMLEGAGFEVIDLGVQVKPEKFVAAIEQHQPDIVGFSAFLTTTMPMFKANLNALEKAGLRDSVIVMVGGAPVTQEYADVVGADGYAADASQTVKRAKALLERAPRQGHGMNRYDGPVRETVLRSATKEVVMASDRLFCIIGERINPTGRKLFQERCAPVTSRSSRRTSTPRSPAGPMSSTSTWASRSPTRPSCWSRRSGWSDPERPADLHRLLGRRGRSRPVLRHTRSGAGQLWSPRRTSGSRRSSRWSRSTTPPSSRCPMTPTRSPWRPTNGSS